MNQRIRVIIADDHPVILFGAAQALVRFPEIEVVGQARQSTELIQLLQKTPCDVLVSDLAMPGGQFGDGMPLLGYIGRQFGSVRIVVLTMLENPALLKRLREVGVNAVISKADDLSHIGLAIVQVMRGQEYIGPSVQAALDSMGLSASGQQRDVVLSKRELEVVRLFVSGMTITEIAAHLRRSIKTISTQKNTAMRKLGIDRESELFQYAQSNGLLNLASYVGDGNPDTPSEPRPEHR
ncbi:two component transcriptional regulator, LuxR family [Caballeronia arationis]|jgi:two-component system capsular synthesis response regulator RcsB|uniref:Two component transcriptional regulator, LuxR family n=1 Tax=Caballeronia arationis TaxID=1777142 RepID=A0A7Z7I6M5_9BURK|nr:response regulator [Caballeronia arationis]SOE80239.1 two component transcriptional regulator, LuxR family [Caballeronia arationis]